jgi:hypothetical protein
MRYAPVPLAPAFAGGLEGVDDLAQHLGLALDGDVSQGEQLGLQGDLFQLFANVLDFQFLRLQPGQEAAQVDGTGLAPPGLCRFSCLGHRLVLSRLVLRARS